MAIERNKLYKPMYKTDRRYILLTGGRGSSKSFESATYVVLNSYDKNERTLYTRYTMTSAEISIIPEFLEKIQLLEVPHHFRANKTDIVNRQTKSDIIFRGIKTSSGQQTANLKSINGVTVLVIEEAEELVDEDVFDTIDLSIRTKKKHNRVIIIMNPSFKEHWVYKRWFTPKYTKLIKVDGVPIEMTTHPDVLHIHTTYLDNKKHLDEGVLKIIQRMKEDHPKKYGHKILGQWSDIAEGSLFDSQTMNFFKMSDKINQAFETSLSYIDIADEGADHLCMVVGRNIGLKTYVVDVVYTDAGVKDTLSMCALSIKKHKVAYCRVESNFNGGRFADELQKLVPGCAVIKAYSGSNKHTRIMMDSPHVNEYFYFLEESEREPMYEKYISHMVVYTKVKNEKIPDDAPDATSGLATFARAMIDGYD